MQVASLDKCGHCGMIHTGSCPRIKAIEYYENGAVRRVEYRDDAVTLNVIPPSDPKPFSVNHVAEGTPVVSPPSQVVGEDPWSPPTLWASSIGDTYHLPNCRYAGSVRHGLQFPNEASAQASGRRPCEYCVGATAVR